MALNIRKSGEVTETLTAGDNTIVAFVDLVGSSRSWYEQPAMAMISVVKRFHDIVLKVAATHNGLHIKGIGDEVMLRFDNHKDLPMACYNAIRAAVDIQKTLKNDALLRKRKANEGLLCKIAIHYVRDAFRIGYDEEKNPPELSVVNKHKSEPPIPKGYFRDVLGHDVNLASRIAKIVGQDQILISKEALQLLRPNQKTKLKKAGIVCSSQINVYGFHGIKPEAGVMIQSVAQGDDVERPRYPVRALVRIRLTSSWRKRKSGALKKLLGDAEVKSRCLCVSTITPEPRAENTDEEDDFFFIFGALDIDDFTTFMTKKFYTQDEVGWGVVDQKTKSLFLRTDTPRAPGRELKKTRCVWLIQIGKLSEGASLKELEKMVLTLGSKKTDKVSLNHYGRLFGDFDAYCVLSANDMEDLQAFEKKIHGEPNLVQNIRSYRAYGLSITSS